MKILKIPSVVEFYLKEKVEDFLAKELFQIVRNRGSRFVSDSHIENLENSNKYLNHQFDRLRNYAKAEDFERFDYLAKILLKKSKVYRVYALNHVIPNYHVAAMTKVLKWLSKVDNLAQTESNEFKYKRTWIDKLVGDAARPLGVPWMEHRIYGHMMTRIMEAYLCGTNQYTSNQHGGTPGRGTLSYITELAKKFLKHERIYEFDLKGYFDHLSHKSITDLFQSKVILHYLSGVLKAKPVAYSLPSEEEDPAAQRFKELSSKTNIIKFDNLSPMAQAKLDKLIAEGKTETILDTPIIRSLDPTDYGFIIIDCFAADLPDFLMQSGVPTFEWDNYVSSQEVDEWDEAIAKVKGSMTLAANYKDLMDQPEMVSPRIGESIKGIRTMTPFTESDRNEGRDNWKELDLPNQGVPQGSSFGPVLASVLLGHIMPKDSLIYMDDGIVFLKDSDQRTTTELNERYNLRVGQIMCEVNKAKSRVLGTSELLTKGLKIIGTRWTKVRNIWSDSMTVKSETRKGISKLLFSPTPLEAQKIFAEFLNNGLITPSKRRLLRWYIFKGKLNRVVGSDLFDVASRIKVLGNILSRAYSPSVSIEEMKEEIDYGIFKAELQLKASVGSLGERVINGFKTILIETTEGPREVKPNLYNVRAICNNVLLRYLKGELPVRKLRVQGLRKSPKF